MAFCNKDKEEISDCDKNEEKKSRHAEKISCQKIMTQILFRFQPKNSFIFFRSIRYFFIQPTVFNVLIKCLALTRLCYSLLSIAQEFRSVTAVYMFFFSRFFSIHSKVFEKETKSKERKKICEFIVALFLKPTLYVDLSVLHTKLVKHAQKLC